MTTTGVIYALRRSGTTEIRYVGKTMKPPHVRLGEHKKEARGRGHAYLHKWLRSIDLDVELVVLEEVAGDDLDQREREWIASLRDAGVRLTNLTEGGTGGDTFTGRKHTPETRAKMSESRRKRPPMSEEQRARMRGRRHSPEVIAKISAAKKGRSLSAEHRAAISAGQMGRPLSAEHRAAISAGVKGKPSVLRGRTISEEHRANISAAKFRNDGRCHKGHDDWEPNGFWPDGSQRFGCRTCRRERRRLRRLARVSDPL